MTEKNTACQVEMYAGSICGRTVHDDKGMCICHSEHEDKDAVLFDEEIQKIFKDVKAEILDLTKFVFHKECRSFMEKRFEKDAIFYKTRFDDDAIFDNAIFAGRVIFDGAQFSKGAYFYKVKFKQVANFVHAKFSSEVEFSLATFSGETDFTFVQFAGAANFINATFQDETRFMLCIAKSDAIVTFDSRPETLPWREGATFYGFKIEKDAVVIFRKVSMEGVKLLESNISRMEFIDVRWPQTSRWHKRRTVADEMIDGKKDYSLIAQVYQGLQENYANWYRYLEAGDFFVGEQEMRRKGKGPWGQYFSLNNAYRILSYYGQSMLLPLFWLLGVISIVPGLLMYGGIGLNLQDKTDIVNYDWSSNISDLIFLKADYWQTFLFNFSFMAFSRSKMHDALTEPWQLALVNIEALVVIGLVAMSLLAVRRRFKRKNF